MTAARLHARVGWQPDLGLLHRLCLKGLAGERPLGAMNVASNRSQRCVPLSFDDLADGLRQLDDRIGDATFVRETHDPRACGLWLDLPAWV